MKMYRQGDVLLIEVSETPKTEKRRLNSYKDRLLVTGEHSNHAHYATGGVDVLDSDGEIYLTAEEEFQMEHLLIDSGVWTKEHHPITLPPGEYKVVRQTEYNPYEKAIEYVQD